MVPCQHVLGVLLLVTLPSAQGWFFRNSQGRKNCFCTAVNNNNYGQVLKDFGSIQRCQRCLCRKLKTCGTECDQKVKEWARDHGCDGLPAGTKIRASYRASGCNRAYAADMYACGQQNNWHRG